MKHKFHFDLLKRQKPNGLLGLSLDGSQLEGVLLRRTNGFVQVQQTFSATLSLDPLTNDPELVGREIRNHLEAAEIRERRCAICLPLKWALLAHTKLPDLPEADLASLLQIEAERGFPCDVATLQVATSRYQLSVAGQHATMIGIPRNHVELLERVLRAAQLRPVSLALGLTALQPAEAAAASGVLALAIGESNVGLQITCGGGVAALRALEGALENEGGRRQLHADVIAREIRITLGQLPTELRDQLHRVRVFGPRDLAQELAEELQPRLGPLGLKIEVADAYATREFGVEIPASTPVSAAFSLAARHLAGHPATLEFLPPKVSAWQQLTARYSSSTVQRAGVAAGAAGLLVMSLFLAQQWQLWRLGSQWKEIGPKVVQLEAMQQQIRQYRPWFDQSMRNLSILRQLTDAFPETGVVSAKTVEIRDQSTVTCSGSARDNQAVLRTLEKLRASPLVTDVKLVQMRGKSPMQFTFEFHWTEGSQK